jgi:hypothetical protein
MLIRILIHFFIPIILFQSIEALKDYTNCAEIVDCNNCFQKLLQHQDDIFLSCSHNLDGGNTKDRCCGRYHIRKCNLNYADKYCNKTNGEFDAYESYINDSIKSIEGSEECKDVPQTRCSALSNFKIDSYAFFLIVILLKILN